jgi:hypothetical protein
LRSAVGVLLQRDKPAAAATAFSLTVPPSQLAVADEVIE